MIHHYIPRGEIAPFIHVFWLTENTFRDGGMERVLPAGTMQLIINLHDKPILACGRGNSRRPEAVRTSIVAGAHTNYLVIDTSSIVNCLGIVFKPGGAAPFFPLPMTELRNNFTSLDIFWGAEADAVREQLLEADTPRQCFATFERFLVQKLKQNFETIRENQPFIRHAVNHLCLSPGGQCLDRIKSRCGYGTTRFIQLFSSGVGLTPKLFSRIQRFQQVLNTIYGRQSVHWADLALDHGYYDQAHFIHEFRNFTGITPGDYFSKRTEDLNHLQV